MSSPEENLGVALLTQCELLCETAKKAERNAKSLSGENFYGNQFHERLVAAANSERLFIAALENSSLDGKMIQATKADLAVIKSTAPQRGKRGAALKTLSLFIHGAGAHALSDKDASPTITDEPVLPKAVVTPAGKSYLVSVVIQANACHTARCYDACAVMVRKLVEILIIELYESAANESEIKNSDGDYLMLSGLIDNVLKAPHWSLARDTKSTLPKVKALGDRAAHNRRFLAKSGDLQNVLPGLRVIVDDLLHLAKLK
jgi:hypothetical protein